MPTLYDPHDRAAILDRIGRLTATSSPRWGRMTLGGMLSHLIESARMSNGSLEVKPKGQRLFHLAPVRYLALNVLPLPKGAPTAPELLSGPVGEFESDRRRLIELLTSFAEAPDTGAYPAHPLFGPLSRREWGLAVHKHTDHHLTQFGV